MPVSNVVIQGRGMKPTKDENLAPVHAMKACKGVEV
jgi:hypothetical protein